MLRLICNIVLFGISKLIFSFLFSRDVFGSGVWPDVEKVKREFGGNKPNATNIFFLQSSQDPWQWAGVRSNLKPTEQEYTV
jgi:hypothetical protein